MRFLLRYLILTLTIFLLPAAAGAQEPLGPPPGTALPHSLSVAGGPDFEALKGENGMALYFIRSVDWCPYCQAQVIETSAAYDSFTDLGLEVVYLSYDSAEDQAAFKAKHDINGRFVSDPGSDVIRAFGLLNTHHEPGSFGYGIPFPAVFIVNADGIIDAVLYEEDYLEDPKSYRKRPATDIILEAAAEAVN